MSKHAMRSSWLAVCGAAAILGSAVASNAAWADEPKCPCPQAAAASAGVPLLTKVPYIHRLFKNVGTGSNCPVSGCCEAIGVDFDWVVADAPVTKAVTCDKACGKCNTVATATAADEKKCADCRCATAAVATKACTATGSCTAKTCPAAATTAVSTTVCSAGKCCQEACKSSEVAIIAPAGSCQVTATCPANAIPHAVMARAAGCCCPENCTTTSCATSRCPAAAQCAQVRGELPTLGLPFAISQIVGLPLPGPGPWEAPPSPAELYQALLESEKGALEAVMEAREELYSQQLEMVGEVKEMQGEMFGALAKAAVEKATLEARLEAQKEHSQLVTEMHKLMAENARLKAHAELAAQREELVRETLQLALENERLKHRVAELEQHHAGDAARTATAPRGSHEAR